MTVGSLPPVPVARGEFLPRAGGRGRVRRVSQTPPRSLRRPADPRTRLLRSALDVMNCLLHEPRSLGISEVAARLALPKSTTFRVLRALVELELVHKDAGTRRYSLTSRVFGLAHELSLHFGPLGRFSKVLRSEAARLRASLYVSTLCGGLRTSSQLPAASATASRWAVMRRSTLRRPARSSSPAIRARSGRPTRRRARR